MISVTCVVVTPRKINDARSVVKVGREHDQKMKNVVTAAEEVKRSWAPPLWDHLGVQECSKHVAEPHGHFKIKCFHHRRRDDVPNEEHLLKNREKTQAA